MKSNGVYVPNKYFADQISRNPLYKGLGTYRWSQLARVLDTVSELDRCEGLYGRVALDVGAHCGLLSRVLADYFYLVQAFEPVPDFHEMFRKNCKGLSNVDIFGYALSDENQTVRLLISEDEKGTARVERGALSHDQDRIVALGQVYDTIKENQAEVDLVKLSCEGFEVAALKGMMRTVTRSKPVILIEQKPKRMARHGYSPLAGVELLKEWGYRVEWEMDDDYCMVSY
jgi:FkbM family methyltransferase